jgi:hypothetical protein
MSLLPKGERLRTKLVELFANRVVERRNMINVYLRGRACTESIRGSLILGEFLILSFSFSFLWSHRFSCILLALRFFLLLDNLLELILAFWSSTYASWGFRFELQTLCFLLSMDSSREILRNQVVSSLV